MDLQDGFQIEVPAIVVPWGIGEPRLAELLPGARSVTAGYRTLDVVSLAGLHHVLGFHFDPRDDGRLVELEFFRREAIDLTTSYADFEEHLEATFGPPTESRDGPLEFPAHRWSLAGAEIEHYVFDRFGPEEHVRIRRS